MIECQKCRHHNPDTAEFCGNCGAYLWRPDPKPDPPTSTPPAVPPPDGDDAASPPRLLGGPQPS